MTGNVEERAAERVDPPASDVIEAEALRRIAELRDAHRRELARVAALAAEASARHEHEIRTQRAEIVALTRLIKEAEKRAESLVIATPHAAVRALRAETIRAAVLLEQLAQRKARRLSARVRRRLRRGKHAELTEQAMIEIARSSHLFNAGWYLDTYPDVKQAGVDPVRHYIRYGASEGRDPGPVFSTARYLRRYPDVAADGMNPLVHFEIIGRQEGRSFAVKPKGLGL